MDWRKSLIAELSLFFSEKDIKDIDVADFVNQWVQAYSANMKKMSTVKSEFETVDQLNLKALTSLIETLGISERISRHEIEHLSCAWHRLKPWPDAVDGIADLKKSVLVAPLSNGNEALLSDLASYSGIEWSMILSAEQFKCYKPNPEVYLKAADKLGLLPKEIVLAASHKYDLQAARICGYQTAYVYRPEEFSELRPSQALCEGEFDYQVAGIDALLRQLPIVRPTQDMK